MLGKYLRKLRIKKGLTQKEVAKLAGVSQQVISNLERGEGYETVEKVLTIYGVVGEGERIGA